MVLEAELRDGSGCTQDQNPGYWFAIGTVDVNSSSIPAPTVTRDRSSEHGRERHRSWLTLQRTADSANGGGPQIVQYDLNFNTGDGVSGFEAGHDRRRGLDHLREPTKTISTAGLTPGQTYTVRARDHRQRRLDAADGIRRTYTSRQTTTVNPCRRHGQTVNIVSTV